jgi:hypothetical protein
LRRTRSAADERAAASISTRKSGLSCKASIKSASV